MDIVRVKEKCRGCKGSFLVSDINECGYCDECEDGMLRRLDNLVMRGNNLNDEMAQVMEAIREIRIVIDDLGNTAVGPDNAEALRERFKRQEEKIRELIKLEKERGKIKLEQLENKAERAKFYSEY